MSIRVQLFAALADFAGVRETEIQYSAGIRCADVWSQMRVRFPRFSGIPPLFARNDEYIRPETELKDGDFLMIFPPVSGG